MSEIFGFNDNQEKVLEREFLSFKEELLFPHFMRTRNSFECWYLVSGISYLVFDLACFRSLGYWNIHYMSSVVVTLGKSDAQQTGMTCLHARWR